MPKVLVADDSITVRKVAERLLTEAGMEVALAASGEEAMAYLSTEHPDFVISDVIMPDKSGYDVCRFVRSQSLLANTPVLLISGIVNEEVNRQAESCRANGVLKKPFQGASLQDRVREILSKQTEKESTPEVVAVNHDAVPSATEPTPSEESVATTSSGPKAYRITEEQLQSFRESASRIKELEGLLEEEKAISGRLREQADQSMVSQSRLTEMETSLGEYQRKIEGLSSDVERLSAVERRNQELEALVAELQSAPSSPGPESPSTNANHPTMAELQALLADQQQRLADLARNVMMHGESTERLKALETAVSEEQGRASALAGRCATLEEELARANGRVDDCTKLLERIGRLASKSEESR
jgi:DNA-binding response OmpR family regulator